jgi:subtilisin family serine protease
MAAGAAALAAFAGVLAACSGGTTNATPAGNTGQDAVSSWCSSYGATYTAVEKETQAIKDAPSLSDSEGESAMAQLAPQAATLAAHPPPVIGVKDDWTAGFSLLSKGAAAFSHGDVNTGTSYFNQASPHIQALNNDNSLQSICQ